MYKYSSMIMVQAISYINIHHTSVFEVKSTIIYLNIYNSPIGEILIICSLYN